MSKVFVVTPFFCTQGNQRLSDLLETLYWVRRQSYRDYLHVVVDDGSTDRSIEVVEEIAAQDSRLKVFQKSNGGSSSAIIFGVAQALRIAKPDFITICHSDDVMLPGSLQARLDTAQRTGSEFVHSDYLLMTEDGVVRRRRAKDMATAAALYQRLLSLKKAVLYPTMFWEADFFLDRIGGFDPEITSAEDWDIALRTAQQLIVHRSAPANCRAATMLKRNHAGCLRIQNTLDGTKARCYERIFRKHLKGREYDRAMAKARQTRLHPSTSSWRPRHVTKALRQVPGFRSIASMLRRRTAISLDRETNAFLYDMREIGAQMRCRRAA